MQITTKIKWDSGNEHQELEFDKFFQFIILSDINNGKCKVIIYTAVSFHSEYENERLHFSFQCNKKTPTNIAHQDKSNFYNDELVVKQFWGERSKVSSDLSSVIKECLVGSDYNIENTESIRNGLDKDSSKVLYIEQSKDNIRKILIQPTKINDKTTDNVILTGCFDSIPKDLRKYVSNGYWFKTEFEDEIEHNQKGFTVKSNIVFENAKFKSPDFKIYFQTRKNYELKTSTADIEFHEKEEDENAEKSQPRQNEKCEIIKVFSQTQTQYFDEWAKLGIYVSSLFRIKTTTQLERKIFTNGISAITFSAQMEDLESPRKREIHLLILSIIFSLFCSIGLDVTRQGTPEFIRIFPTLFKSHASSDFLWLAVCLGVLVKYLFVTTSKINIKIRRFIIPAPVVTWLSIYVVAIPVPDIALHSAYYIDIGISVYCLLSFLYIINFRPPMPIATDNVGRFHRILRSITGT
ncbi:hypothetical protein [Aeromonas sp. AE23HZ002T15]